MPNITDGNLVQVVWDSTNHVLRLVPYNSEGKAALDAFFAGDGALTTVAIAQEDAVRGGYGDVSKPYQSVKFTLS